MIINLLRSAAKNNTNPPNGLRAFWLGTILPSTHAQIADATACGKSFYNLWTNIFENFSTQNCWYLQNKAQKWQKTKRWV